MIRQAGLITIGIIVTATAHAQAYRCKDAAGKVSYQEAPCQADQAQKEVEIKKAAPLSEDDQRILKATASGKVTRGMTAAQVRSSWGAPTKINQSTGSYGVHEQWVYDRGNFRAQYVYLQNGVVTSFQSPSE